MTPKASRQARQFREPKRTAKNLAWYDKRLQMVAKAIGQIVRQYDETKGLAENAQAITQALFDYQEGLKSWATEVASMMLSRVADDDFKTWEEYYDETSRKLSAQTRAVLQSQEKGSVYFGLMAKEVDLITSLPHDAAEKVHEWVTEGLSNGQRPEAIRGRIRQMLPDEIKNRATLIARTETARARSNFTEARARAVGSTHYIWKTVGDARVRPMHAALNNTIQSWDNPPLSDYGKGGEPIYSHPGCVWNCRCFASPLLPDED